mmetsp:Transcript_1294/g.3154  ORF Transcript_1294/g.3154 Transcript_1294/m.3154 type:complete len:138 (-) Transcript_1294:110-523(-)|eukprot:CAMPEP_0170618946 /NCGR_PEP_ID=MMETSP0224-20130122/27245_1 /TAXON_ID=285029 /ORGANISM="Togula jolla, Strain CCCM 725" /LENGTH=137 /DNA_ID=CAMNT_0010944985 /DNA_START=68 /DNA_END=481 /DNA_ORIENTATION=+
MAGGIIEGFGIGPRGRGALFYGVCIWVRLGMAAAVYFGRNETGVQIAVIAVGAFVALQNLRKFGEAVWWSRPLHFTVACVFIAFAILALLNVEIKDVEELFPTLMAVVLVIDVALGLLTSFIKCPFTSTGVKDSNPA